MGKFVVHKRFNGEYQFNLKASNGQIILSSEGYTTKGNCLNGIESVKTNSKSDDRFDRKTSSNGKYYFNLKASNGQIIGTSELYETESARENGIQSVKVNASTALIDDFTL
ncbi:YegP family protein [Sphingobacterium multivorum]|uniref:YegP family protein n=1 Tax=Sphingobacterium multivorum TaxID=28454 RepID=UPI0031B9D963